LALSRLELKLPPPLVALLCAAWGWEFAGAAERPAWRLLLAFALGASGLAIALSGVFAFLAAKTTISPLDPNASTTIVTSGIYSRTRNPMYLGVTIILCGWAAHLWTPWALLAPAAFALYVTRFQILPEERILRSNFGAPYEDYLGRVRRWL
jgi:protein-S-isoprenylcysteine O-methyltransferase Ste14